MGRYTLGSNIVKLQYLIYSYISEPGAATASLASAASTRIFSGYRPATLAAYTRYFKDFLGFLVVAQLSLPQATTLDVLAYMEHLLQSGMSVSNITNHIAGIRAMFVVYGLNPTILTDSRIALFLKAVRINRPLQPHITLVLDASLLSKILQVCHHLHHTPVFQALYSFCFFSFLRLSNVLPHSVAKFDPSRHLCRADVIFGHSKAVIIIKWSKTLQDRCKTTSVAIPALGQSPLCPVVAIRAMFQLFPADVDSPLFQIPVAGSLVPLTDSIARKHLKQVSTALALAKPLTFHDFRRAGASWAFQHGVPLQNIQAQGTWTSQCVWRYVHTSSSGPSRVADSFRAHLAI